MSDVDSGAHLARVFSRAAVRSLAGLRSFERGVRYAEDGRVGDAKSTSTSATATVRGSEPYYVELAVRRGKPAYACSCPVGVDRQFCKHLVATALVVTGQLHAPAPVDIGPTDPATVRRLIDNALTVRRYVDYSHMPDFARRVHDAIDVLRVLLESGQAEAVVALAERALDRADKASARVDDSDGYLGGIAADLAELHLAACRMTRPDSVELARRLYGWARHGGDLRSLTADVERYQDVLGEAGVAEYRRLAEADWVNVPVLRAGDNDAVDGDRFRITAIMESLAEASGDIDAIVSVYARDQSTVYRLLRIADVYRAAGRHADARQWLEKAINAFGAVDPRLIDTLAEEYHYAGRAADAVSLCWRAYESQPTPENYRRLRANATAAGVWAHWHEHAMATLRRRVAARIAAGPQPSGYPLPGLAGFVTQPDASALVSVLLYEDDVEQAWVEAQAGGCSEALWADLAARREADHPADAIPIWQRHAERAIAIGSNQGYEEAVAMMARVRRLMSSAATPDAFVSYIAGIRLAYHRKRNLMKLLDQRGW